MTDAFYMNWVGVAASGQTSGFRSDTYNTCPRPWPPRGVGGDAETGSARGAAKRGLP